MTRRSTAPPGVVEDAGDSGLAVGSRVMFTGPYGVGENGTWQEWLLARPEHLALVPDTIDDAVAASLPVAYLTAQVTLRHREHRRERDQ
jgi:NADPH:quinone reductase